MHRDELLKQLAPWREKHARLTWKPVVSETDGPTTATSSWASTVNVTPVSASTRRARFAP